MRPLTIGQNAQQAQASLGARPVAFSPRRGGLGRSLMFFAASLAAVWFGAKRLGLTGSPLYVDNSLGSHWLAAIFLVAGGVYFMSGWASLWGRGGRANSVTAPAAARAEATEPVA